MKSKNIYKVLSLIFSLLLVILLGYMGWDSYQKAQAQKQFDSLRDETVAVLPTEETPVIETEPETEAVTEAETETETEPETEPEAPKDILTERGIEVPDLQLDWEKIRKTNQDIYAWIYIPGTRVDYPVLQHPTEDDYYLDRNLDKSKGYPGCIYSQLLNSMDFTDRNTVLYGHNMKNGTMFQTLHNYEDSTFFAENRYCFIYLPDGQTLVYDIYAAYVSGNEHILYTYQCNNSDEKFTAYLDKMAVIRDMNAKRRDGVNVTSTHHILTLSTCVGNASKRFLVQGVLVNDPQLTYEEQMTLYGE